MTPTIAMCAIIIACALGLAVSATYHRGPR